MSKTLSMIPVLILFVASIGICSNVTTVIDQKNNRIELTTVHTKNIILSVDWVNYTIPIEEISTIVRSKDKDKLVLTTVTGKTLEGKTGSKSKIEGKWELGEYSIALSDIKSVDFGRGVQQEGKSTVPSQTDGFFATCTDRNGDVVQVYSFIHIFKYKHHAPRTWLGGGMQVFGWDEWRSTARAFLPFRYRDVTVAIPFMQINTITFTDTNDMLPKDDQLLDWPFSVTIELHDGAKLSGKTAILGMSEVSANPWCNIRRFGGVTGVTQVKGFSIPFDKVQQITFNHARDKNVADMDVRSRLYIPSSLDSPYSMSIKTRQGSKILLQNACIGELSEDGYWEELETEFQIGIGDSENIVDFDKIRAINFKFKENADQIITSSGTTIDGVVYWKHRRLISGKLGGKLEKLGPGFISMKDVASLEISHIKKQ